jgi:hypothetical protein
MLGVVPEPLMQPPFEPHYEASFDADRQALGLSGSNFNFFFETVERYLGNYPWKYSEEIPNSGGIRMLPTRDAFPDIPPLYVYYRVGQQPNKIYYLGLSPAWSKTDVV